MWTSPSGKSYIGQAINLKKRWREFRKPSNIYYTSKGSAIDNARNKYTDYDNQWQYKILEECAKEDLDIKETYYIKLYDTFNKGYNSTVGGDGTKGRVMEDWQKNLCSDKMKKQWKEGKMKSFFEEHPEWNKEHIYERTDEIKTKISDGLKDYYKTHSNAIAKKCTQYDLDMNLIAEYPSISKAAKAIGVDQSSISGAIKKGRPCKGYIFVKE